MLACNFASVVLAWAPIYGTCVDVIYLITTTLSSICCHYLSKCGDNQSSLLHWLLDSTRIIIFPLLVMMGAFPISFFCHDFFMVGKVRTNTKVMYTTLEKTLSLPIHIRALHQISLTISLDHPFSLQVQLIFLLKPINTQALLQKEFEASDQEESKASTQDKSNNKKIRPNESMPTK